MVRRFSVQLIFLFYGFFLWSFVLGAPCLAQETANLGIFSATADWGMPESPPIRGKFKAPGRVEISGDEENLVYDIFGNGDDIYTLNDEGYYVYRELSGSWRISAKIELLERGGGLYPKFGIVLREKASSSNSRSVALFYLLTPIDHVNALFVLANWRNNDDSQMKTKRITKYANPIPPIYFRITRYAIHNLFILEYSNDGVEWVFGRQIQQEMDDRIAWGLAIDNNIDNELLAHGRASEVTIEPAPPIASRSVQAVRNGENVILDVRLSIHNVSDYPSSINLYETIPVNSRVESIDSDGKTSNGTIIWRNMLPPGETIINYRISALPDAKGFLKFVGGIDSLPILGRNSWINTDAQFDEFADFGIDNPAKKIGEHKVPGRVKIMSSTEGLVYDVFGNGNPITYSDNEGVYLSTERSGSWAMTARMEWINYGGWNPYAGLSIRQDGLNPNSFKFDVLANSPFNPILPEDRREWRFGYLSLEDGLSSGGLNQPVNIDESSQQKHIYLRATRIKSTHTFFAECSLDGKEWYRINFDNAIMDDPIRYGLLVSNFSDNEQLAHVRFTDVSFSAPEPYAIRYVLAKSFRNIQSKGFTTHILVYNPTEENRSVTITENLPDQWIPSGLTPNGTIEGNRIIWNLNLTPGYTLLSYVAIAPAVPDETIKFQGRIDAAEIFGDDTLKSNTMPEQQHFFQSILIGIPCILFVIHFALFIFYPKLKENLYYSLFLVSYACFIYWYIESNYLSGVDARRLSVRIYLSCFVLAWLCLCRFYHCFLHQRTTKQYWGLLFIGTCAISSLWLVGNNHIPFKNGNFIGGPYLDFILWICLISILESLRSMIVACMKRVRGIWIIAIGGLLTPLAYGYYALTLLGYMPLTLWLEPWILNSVLVFYFCSSVFLAWRFAQANKDLEILNVNLEDRVEQRTQELNTMNVELQDANAQLIQLDQMKTQFVSQASHDLRTPLTAIKGSLDNLLMGIAGALNEKQQKVMTRATTSVDRLTNLINDVLDLNRIETGRIVLEKSDIPFKALVENIINENHPAAELKHITLKADLGVEINLHIDGSKIERVVGELISNAIKYTPDNGIVDVGLSHEAATISLSVKDSGIGMTAEECSKIWERFYRTSASKKFAKGSGLGLSIAKELVELHNGSIELTSKQGQGTTFTLRLPIKGE